MYAFVVLLLAALSRFLPFMMHQHAGYSITAVWAGLLFFGSRRPRWQAGIAVAVMAATDVLLTKYVYGYPFHAAAYAMTWAWYAGACLIGSGLLRKVTVLRVAASVVASATGFFLLSNFAVWAGGQMYVHNAAGLLQSYAQGLPFYGNDLVSTGFFAAVLFGAPVLVAKLAEMLHDARNRQTLL